MSSTVDGYKELREEFELLGADAVGKTAQTALFYSATWYGTTIQFFTLGHRTWTRRSKGAPDKWTRWKLGSVNLSGTTAQHVEAAVLIPLSAAQAGEALTDSYPPSKAVRFGDAVLAKFRKGVLGE